MFEFRFNSRPKAWHMWSANVVRIRIQLIIVSNFQHFHFFFVFKNITLFVTPYIIILSFLISCSNGSSADSKARSRGFIYQIKHILIVCLRECVKQSVSVPIFYIFYNIKSIFWKAQTLNRSCVNELMNSWCFVFLHICTFIIQFQCLFWNHFIYRSKELCISHYTIWNALVLINMNELVFFFKLT